ncbi:TetR/AcrR family transcriptional regulator [Streptomyces sp. NPDC001389]|uniref:TetR/AcrR family transcriptional regulator n=1 Tax=Streptomyces sp. NPDC001389 TaxID=3364569 RepID=UPI0036C88C70
MRTDAAEVLKSAIPLLSKDRAASMQTVATRAGISRATLVRLFPTRQDLLQAVADKILDDCERILSRTEDEAAPTSRTLDELIGDYRPFAQLWNLVYVEPEVFGADQASDRASVVFRRTVSFVERAQKAGLMRTDMPAPWLASTFCSIAETAWELTLEGHMGARQAPEFIQGILQHGVFAEGQPHDTGRPR